MDTFKKDEGLAYHTLPKQVSRKEFNQLISPHLSRGKRGPKTKISHYKIFNYVLYVLHTGIQWEELKTRNHELHWSNIYRWHNRWSKDGSYKNLFLSSVMELDDQGKLDLSILHGDGSNTVAKKGARRSGTRDTSIRRVRKH